MSIKKIKVMTIVGTRPEIIRLSRVINTLNDNLNHILVHTGQNYDYELNEKFFLDLKIKKPNYFLNIETSSLGKVLGGILIEIEKVLIKEKPDAVLILGDTNSSIASIIVKRFHIPIYHMEAGNRSYDLNVPEEINRKIIDHVSDFNLVYTEHSRRHLISEGLPHRRIYLTGSPMKEVIDFHYKEIEKSKILNILSLEKNNFFIVSIHREENVDNFKTLKKIINIFNKIAEKYKTPIIVSTHPRTRKKLKQLENIKINDKIKFLKPFGFFDYLKLQKNAKCVISDSGTISEESSIVNFPAITLRKSMERPEALDNGSIIITGFDIDIVLSSIEVIIKQFEQNQGAVPLPSDYNIDNVSQRVLNLILGTSKLSNSWDSVDLKNELF